LSPCAVIHQAAGTSDRVDIFNGLTGAWTAASLSAARSYLTATSLPDKGIVLFAGGFNGVGGRVTDVSMEIAPSDRVPGASGALVTMTFTTATDMEAGDMVTFSYPARYFQAGSPTVISQSPASVFTTTQSVSTKPDTEAPVIVFSSIVTELVSPHDKKVFVSVLLEDSSSFQYVYLDYKTSSNNILRCSNWEYNRQGTPQYVFGNRSKAFYKMSCSLPNYISNGQYSIHIRAVDRAFNSLYQELGSFVVTGGAAGDNEPPVLVSSSIFPPILSPGQAVSVSVHFQDPSGLSSLSAGWSTRRNNLFFQVKSCFGYFGGIGNSYSTSFACSLDLGDGAAATLPNGQYFLHAQAFDNHGNFLERELASLNITGSFEDFDPPVLVSSSVSPQNATPGQNVDISFRLEDSSYIHMVQFKLKTPQYQDMYMCSSGHFLYPVSVFGTTAVYQVSCNLHTYQQYINGRYSVEIEATDRAFNRLNVQLGTFDVIGGIESGDKKLDLSRITLSQTASPEQTVLASFELQDSSGFQFVMLSWRNLNGNELQCPSTGRNLSPVSASGTGALYNNFCTLPCSASGTYSVQLLAFDRYGMSLFRELGTFNVLGTTAAGTRPQITPSLLSFGVTFATAVAGTTPATVTMTFTPTNVASFSKVVVTLTGFTSTATIVVAGFTGITGTPAATATLTSNVLTVTFTAGALTAATAASFTLTNIVLPSVAQAASTSIAAATLAGSTVLDTTATGTLAAVTPSLLSFGVTFATAVAGTTPAAVTVTFTPTNVASFSKVVVTLTGFTSTATIVVAGFTGITGTPAATATLTSNVLTVTFTAGALTAATAASFTLTNIVLPSVAQAASTSIAAATLAGSTVLDTTATGTLAAVTPSLLSFGVTFATAVAGTTPAAVTVTFTPTNVASFSKVVVTLTGFTSTATIVVAGFTGITGTPAATATLTSNVLTVTFTAGALTAATAASFTLTNIVLPSVAQAASTSIAAATLAGSTVLDTTATGTLAAVTPSLLSFGVTFATAVAGTTPAAVTMTFTPTNVASFSKVVVTLTGFTSTATIVVAGFTGITGTPAATATLTSNVLTVTFTAGALTAATAASFTLTNIVLPSVAQAASTSIAAATLAGSTVLDTTATGTLAAVTPSLLSFGVTFATAVAGTTPAAVTVTFTPTNVASFSKVVVTLTGFTSTATIVVAGFTGITGTPAATATLTSNVLTVTFTAGALTAGTAASFTLTNIVLPSVAQAASTSIAAATLAGSTVLDTTATGTLAEIAAFTVVPSDCNAGFSFSIAAATIAPAATYKLVFSTAMGSPRNASYGVYVATTRDLMSPVVSSPALGGQVTGVSFTIAAVDRVPFATGKTVTVSFSTQTALAAGQSVTIIWPSGYLTGTMGVTAPFGFSTSTSLLIGPLPSDIMLTYGVRIDATQAVAAGPLTITLTGATVGGPISASSSGISVSTSTDQAGTCGYPALGGQVTGVSFTIAAVDRVPFATGKTVTVSFSMQTALAAGQSVTITWPSGYLTMGGCCVQAFGLSAVTNPIGPLPSGHLGVRIDANAALAAGPLTITLTGATVGGPISASSSGISVSTSTDQAGTCGYPALGGQVTGVSFTIAAADRVPFATGKTVTVSFTTQTALAAGQSVTITWPSGYLTMGGCCVQAFGLSAVTNPIGPLPSGHLGVRIDANAALAAGPLTITLTGATVGGPISASSSGISVSTSTDQAGTCGYPALGGQVTGVSFTIAAVDRVPFATGKTVTVSFSMQTALAAGQSVTITWPSGYLTMGGCCVQAFGLSAVTNPIGPLPSGHLGLRIDATQAVVAGPLTITLTGATVGGPISASSSGISVSTSTDQAGTCGYPALGGQVTGVSFTIAAADRVPFATGKTVTVSFTTQTALATGHSVTITWPSGYLTMGGCCVQAFGLSAVTNPIGPLPSGHLGVRIDANAALAAGPLTITLTGATVGGPISASSSGISVSTSTDQAGTCGYPALGGQVTGVSFTIAAADRVPFATGKTVTVSFTTQTALAAGQSVTITWPSGYLTGTMGVIHGAYGLSAVTNPIGPLPSGHLGVQIVAVAALAAGSLTITLTGATFGGPISASFSGIMVSTSTDQAGFCGYPALGDQVTALGKDKVMSTVDVFDSASGEWHSAAPLSSARFHLASTFLHDIVLFAGGFNGLPPSGNVNII
jgi:hypothetical protein